MMRVVARFREVGAKVLASARVRPDPLGPDDLFVAVGATDDDARC